MQPPAPDTGHGAAEHGSNQSAQPSAASNRKTPSDSKHHTGTANAKHINGSNWCLEVGAGLTVSCFLAILIFPTAHPRQEVRQEHR